jgi:hypothetical protein
MTVLKETLGEHTAVVYYDEDPPSPREWDNIGTVVLGDRVRYNFGDEIQDAKEIMRIARSCRYISLPIFMYDHSGITINTTGFSCPWDSGQVGIIYVSKERAVKEWGNRYCSKGVRSQALQCLRAEIEELDRFITGEVYRWAVYDRFNDLVDSCGGFYCTPEETMKEAKHSLEYHNQRGTVGAA